MFNSSKLRGKMAEMRITMERMAGVLGINPATFGRKMAGESEFTRSEIQKIAQALCLTIQELREIFFAEVLA